MAIKRNTSTEKTWGMINKCVSIESCRDIALCIDRLLTVHSCHSNDFHQGQGPLGLVGR